MVSESDVLVTGDSLAPLLRIALTEEEISALSSTVYATVIATADRRVLAGELTIRKGASP